ncbi:MAG: PHP domain-containing protein [Thermoguttaceae bacterium]|jgi:histidinol phosphatase-like PHP family hydrolase|nr:PHP domain-containing protein [Thermoguttaceae bacterium]
MSNSSRRQFFRSAAALGAAGLTFSPKDGLAADGRDPLAGWINHDLHTHTTWSDGAHSLPLHVLEARAYELDAMAVTDHYGPGQKLHDSEEQFEAYLKEIELLRAGQDDCRVIAGVEAAALDATGRISIGPRHAERLEWVLCDLGGRSEGTLRNTPADKQTYMENVVRTYLGLCDVEYLDGIAHPFNTGNTQPAAAPADYPERLLRELAAKMAEKGKVFDIINCTVFWFQKTSVPPREVTAQYVEMVKLFAAEGVKFQVSSDDHRTGLGNTRWSQIVVTRAEVPPAQIVDAMAIPLKARLSA